MQKKSNSKMLYVAIALLLVVLIGSLVASTYARYATQVKGNATATAAAWSFEANGLGTVETPIDLGNTMVTTYGNLKAGTIAPGTSGSFDIILDGTGSETGIKYTIELVSSTGDNNDLPSGLEIAMDGVEGTGSTGYIEYDAATDAMKKTVGVSWNWTYGNVEGQDNYDENVYDGANNQDAGETYTLNVVVTAEQYIGTVPVTP